MQAKSADSVNIDDCRQHPALTGRPGVRAGLLFVNFFLIITALYQLKPASRSLFLEFLGPGRLPYIWIATALTMMGLIAGYHHLVMRSSRLRVVLGTCLLFSFMLLGFRILLSRPTPAITAAFYVFVDILGVVLVEQFWSLTNAVHTTRQGKAWYGVVGTGGLAGGVAGGALAALLIRYTALRTPDLLLTAAGTVALISLLTWAMGRLGMYCEAEPAKRSEAPVRRLPLGGHGRYLLLIAAILLLAQLVSPLIEYQFLHAVSAEYTEMEARTAFLSFFFSALGLVSIAVNLGLTPLVHRFFGAIAGLLVQPLAIILFSWSFWLQPTLFFGGAAKISDRGLSYSINRASRELLYVPVEPVVIYQAKAWIDMFGYRLFKVAGSLLILICTQWLPVTVSIPGLSWFAIGICGFWTALVFALVPQYRQLSHRETYHSTNKARI